MDNIFFDDFKTLIKVYKILKGNWWIRKKYGIINKYVKYR